MALFFSHGISLDAWRRGGLLSREIGYYRELSRAIGEVVLVTYDTPGETLQRDLEEIRPLRARWNSFRLPYRLFGLFAPLLHFRTLRRARVLKTNQLSGAWTAVIAKWLTGRPLVVRCGFVKSRNAALRGEGGLRLRLIVAAERLAVRSADLLFVATELDREYIAELHGIAKEKFREVPTPIDVDRFAPGPAPRDPRQVLYVGRLVPEKNVDLIIEACMQVPDVKLTIVGTGPLEAELRKKSDPSRVTFAGVVANDELPELIRRSGVFVLASRHEGSPKALLEAMACGAAVVGSDIPAVRRIIEHDVNGLIVPATATDLAAAIGRLAGDPAAALRLGQAARALVVRNYSQSEVVRREAAYLQALTK
jgi:glycosyltransferase involved in cell wall biosynthesis